MKKALETLKNFVTLKTLAALLLIVFVVFFFLPIFTATDAISVSFVPQNFSASKYLIGNPEPNNPAWEHLWVSIALILPLIAIVLLLGEQSTGKSIVISVLIAATIVTWILMLVNISNDYRVLLDEAITKDLASIQSQTIIKEADPHLVNLCGSNIFGLFGASETTVDAVLAKAGVPAGSIVSSLPLYFVSLVLAVASLAITVLSAIGVIDSNRVLVK